MPATRHGTGAVLGALGAASTIGGLAYKGITSLLKSKQSDAVSNLAHHKIQTYPYPIGPNLPPVDNSTIVPLGYDDSSFAFTTIGDVIPRYNFESSKLAFFVFVLLGLLLVATLLSLGKLIYYSGLYDYTIRRTQKTVQYVPPKIRDILVRLYHAYTGVECYCDMTIGSCCPLLNNARWFTLL